MIVVVIKMTIIIIVTHSMDMSSLQEANSHWAELSWAELSWAGWIQFT
jgi:hypothetical protein